MLRGCGGGEVLDRRLHQNRVGARAWLRSPVSRRKWVFGRAMTFWAVVSGLTQSIPCSHLPLGVSPLLSTSLNIFLLILCVLLSNAFPTPGSLSFASVPFLLSDSAGLGPGHVLPGADPSVSLLCLPDPLWPPHSCCCRMCPTGPWCPRASESAP